MIWEVFRQEKQGGNHVHCGNVHAPDGEMALMFAQIQHGRRKPTNSLWVAPKEKIREVDADETKFGGSTDKSYRWATAYVDVEPAADVVKDSEEEQKEAEEEKKKREA